MADRLRVRLGDHVELTTGFPFKSEHYSSDDSGVPLLRGDNIAQGILRWHGVKRWPNEQRAQFQQYELLPGDVVLAMDRPWISAGLKYAMVGPADVPALLVQRVARLRAGPELDQQFLAYLIGGQRFTDHILAVQTGTAVPHVSGKQIGEFEFDLPPLAEQKLVGSSLAALDQKRDLNEVVSRTARDLAASRVQLRSLGSVRLRLGDVADIRKGLSYKGAGLADSGTPMVNLKNAAVFGGFRRDAWKYYTGDYKPRHVARGGDLLVANTDLTWKLEALGWPMLVPDDVDEALFSQDISIIDFRPEWRHLRLSTWAHLFTTEARQRVDAMAYGTTVARFPPEALTGLEVPVLDASDPVLEQAEALLARAWAAERESDALAQLRDALLPALMSGQLQVREAEELVGEAV